MSDASTFDPGRYLTKVGQADYLEVKWRLVWLRETHPDAQISTCLIAHDSKEQWAMFRAEVSIPGGGSASGHGSEDFRGFKEYVEKAETKAIGRALGALGFGTQFSQEFEHGGLVDSPVNLPARDRTTTQNTVPVAGVGGITEKQMAMIRGLAEENGLQPEAIRAMHGKASAKDLTRQEASELIDRLQGRLEAMPEPPNDAERWTS